MKTVNSHLILSVDKKKQHFPKKKRLTICASMQPMEFRILTKSAFTVSRSIIKNEPMKVWSNVDIDQVSFPSVDLASKGLVQKFHIHPVCTGTTEVGNKPVSVPLLGYIPRRFIFLQKTYFYSWFILQVTFDKFCWLKN